MNGSWSTASRLRLTGVTMGVVMAVRPPAVPELIGAREFGSQARWPSGSGPGALTVRIAKFERTSADRGQLEQRAEQEALVGTQVGHDDLEQEVGRARDDVAGDDLGHLRDRLLDRVGEPV